MNYFFSEEELAVNASLDAWDLLVKMGFQESSLYREGNTIRLFCPLHKDQIRRYTEQALFDKVFEWLETKVNTKANPVSYHDFIHQAG